MNTNHRTIYGLCDHCFDQGREVPATHRVLMDDCMGYKEYGYYCDSCHQRAVWNLNHGTCEWCKKESDDLRWVKDFSEGMSEPMYLVCGKCDQAQMDEIERDLDYYGYY